MMIRLVLILLEVFGIIYIASFKNRTHWIFGIGYVIIGILWIGTLLFLFNKKKKSLHDFAAQTVVIENGKVHWWLTALFLLPLIVLAILFFVTFYMQAKELWQYSRP